MSQTQKQASAFGMNPNDELNDLRMSDKAMPLYEHVKRFIAETVEPMSEKYAKLGEGRTGDARWDYAPGQLDLLNGAKEQAKKEGLWNFFLPDAETGEGLSNLDYAYIAVELGKNPLASESMNCSAPDTGNMEVLERVGTPEQKEQLAEAAAGRRDPLGLRDDRGAPRVVGRQERRHLARCCDGDEYVINGEKHYISGAGSPRCKIMITMVRTSPRRAAAQAAVADPGADGHAGREDRRRDACVRRDRRAARPHAHPASTTCACPRPTCCSAKAAASRSASCAWARAASTTACARSARPRRRST